MYMWRVGLPQYHWPSLIVKLHWTPRTCTCTRSRVALFPGSRSFHAIIHVWPLTCPSPLLLFQAGRRSYMRGRREIHTYIHSYIHVHACMHTCMHTCTCIHTYTCTGTRVNMESELTKQSSKGKGCHTTTCTSANLAMCQHMCTMMTCTMIGYWGYAASDQMFTSVPVVWAIQSCISLIFVHVSTEVIELMAVLSGQECTCRVSWVQVPPEAAHFS